MLSRRVPRPRRPAPSGPIAIALACVLSAAAGLALSACHDSKSSRNRQRAELDAARARWEDAGLNGYAVTQRRICFCPQPFEWTVVIGGGEPQFVESVTDPGGSGEDDYALEQAALAQTMTVEDLFDWIGDQLDGEGEIDVTYDAGLGFPATISADPIPQAVDDEISWELSGLTPTGACTEIGCADELRVTVRAPAGGFAAGDYDVTVAPTSGAPLTCSFAVTLGGPCPHSVCVQGASCIAFVPAADAIEVSFPFTTTGVLVTVEIDGKTEASAAVEPSLTRSQPNGPLCPPVCWTGGVEVALP
jgi:hypothetical protein